MSHASPDQFSRLTEISAALRFAQVLSCAGDHSHWIRLPFGPVGSQTWWDAISSGTIEARVLEGTIVKYSPHGEEHGQYACFEVADPEGNTTSWVAHGEVGSLRLSNAGDRVRIKYVLLDVLPDYPGGKELVLEIWRGAAYS